MLLHWFWYSKLNKFEYCLVSWIKLGYLSILHGILYDSVRSFVITWYLKLKCVIFCYYRVAGLLGAVPSFKKLSSSRSDDWIDRMSHIYTTFLLVIFAILVSTGQFVGDPIHCWCPAEFTGAFEAYTKNYCWIKNTYFVPMMESIPVDISERQVRGFCMKCLFLYTLMLQLTWLFWLIKTAEKRLKSIFVCM